MRVTQVEAELRNYYREYPEKDYLELPEFIVQKMGLNISLLENLPHAHQRNKDDIYNWMKNRNFTYEDLLWIGW